MKKIRRKTPRVAVILESSYEIPRSLLSGILKYAMIYGPWGIDIVAGGSRDQRLPDLQHWKGNGIIGRVPTHRVAEEIVRAKLPTVVIDPSDEFLAPEHPISRFPNLQCDSREVGRVAADYFLNGKFTHFAFVDDIRGINWSRYRREAFCDHLREFDFPCHIYPLPQTSDQDWTIERKIMIRWLRKLPKPVALMAANDQRARQVLDACQAASLPVPYQIAILGVNNERIACEAMFPPLSSVALDSENGGYAAAKLLDALMRKEEPKKTELYFGPTGIVSRYSTESIHSSNRTVIKALEFIRANAGMNIRVGDVAKHLGVTRQWAEKIFKRELGSSIMDEIKEVRMRTIRSLVGNTDTSFQEIAKQCGFESTHHLGNIFKERFGSTLSDYRNEVRKKTPEQ